MDMNIKSKYQSFKTKIINKSKKTYDTKNIIKSLNSKPNKNNNIDNNLKSSTKTKEAINFAYRYTGLAQAFDPISHITFPVFKFLKNVYADPDTSQEIKNAKLDAKEAWKSGDKKTAFMQAKYAWNLANKYPEDNIPKPNLHSETPECIEIYNQAMELIKQEEKV